MNTRVRAWARSFAARGAVIALLTVFAALALAAPRADDDDDFEVLLIEALPRVNLTAPVSGSVVQAPGNATLVAAARSKRGYISRIDFYQGSTLLGSRSTPATGTSAEGTWELPWTNIPAGTYALKARAHNNLNQWADSAAISFIVNAPPSITLNCPAAFVAAGQTLTLSAAASDADGGVSRVEFFDGAALIGLSNTPSTGSAANGTWSATWTPTLGPHSLTAKAYDSRGGVVSSSGCATTGATPPSVNISSPTATVHVASGANGSASFAASASAAGGGVSIATIRLYRDGALLHTCTGVTTCSASLNLPAGSYTLRAVATDTQNLSTAAELGWIVNTLPTVTVAVAPGSFTAPAALSYSATAAANDPGDSIARVDYFMQGSQGREFIWSSATPPSYSLTGAVLYAGTFAITAEAIDQRGGKTVSAPVNVNVAAPVNATITSGFDARDVGTFVTNPSGWAWIFNAASGLQKNGSGMTATPAPHGVQTAFIKGGATLGTLGQQVKFTAGNYAINFLGARNNNNTMSVRFKVDGVQVGGDIAIGGTSFVGYTTALFNVPADGTHLIELSATSTNAADIVLLDQVVVVWAPNVTWNSPGAGRIDIANATTTLNLVAGASANGRVNSIAKVQFFNHGAQIGSDVTTGVNGVYTLQWPAGSGSYRFTAKAFDAAGLTSTTALVDVVVNRRPTVSITASPTTGIPGNVVTLTASATDPDGSIARLEIFQDGVSKGFVNAGALSISWTAPNVTASTNFSFTAVATDNLGATTTSSLVTVTIAPPNQPPVITEFTANCAAPCVGPATINFRLVASDPDGNPLTITFRDNGSNVSPVNLGGGNYQLANVAAGPHSYNAVVADSLGASASTTSVAISVAANRPPTITSVSPAQTQIALGGAVTFVVAASDPDSGDSIATVALLSGGSQQATGTLTAPGAYAITWQPGAAGSYTDLRVRATDMRGAYSQSELLAVEVVGAPASTTPNAKSVVPGNYTTPDVGTTPGTFAVSEGGAATYTIPIQVPPGTAGMQPQLALSYNSQGGYGMLGTGWSLSGLSAITRCPMNVAQDGKKAAINYDTDPSNDNYCLDGQRLVVVGNSENGTEYRTGVETYSRILGYSVGNMIGPSQFRVWTKDGRILDYGSRWWVLTAGWQWHPYSTRLNAAKLWVLDKVSDRAGNYMTIDYADALVEQGLPSENVMQADTVVPLPNGASPPQPVGPYPNVEYWPTAIRYYPNNYTPGNPVGFNEVLFTYRKLNSVEDFPQRYYDAGAASTTLTRLLSAIETRADGQRARKYELHYELGSSKNYRLRGLLECGASNEGCIHSAAIPANVTPKESVSFSWSNSGAGFVDKGNWAQGRTFNNNSDTGAPVQSRVQIADLNGDGRSDLVNLQSAMDWQIGQGKQTWQACLSNGASFDCPASYRIEIEAPVPSADFPASWYLADLDGDGRADLVMQWSDRLRLCYSGSQSWACSTHQIHTQLVSGRIFQGDLDGDGRIDYLYYQGTNEVTKEVKWSVCLSTGVGVNCLGAPQFPYKLLKVECEVNDPPELCEWSTGNNLQYQYFAADFNSDGKLDLMIRRAAMQNNTAVEGEEQWRICFSDFGPGGSQEFKCHKGWVRGIAGPIERAAVLDFNGDGLPDMAARREEEWKYAPWISLPEDPTRWQVCLSAGDGAFEFWNPGATPQNVGDPFKAPRCRAWQGVSTDVEETLFGDFNGDGRSDLLGQAGTKWHMCLSTGTSFACSDWGTKSNTGDKLSQVATGDFDGDGRTDLLVGSFEFRVG